MNAVSELRAKRLRAESERMLEVRLAAERAAIVERAEAARLREEAAAAEKEMQRIRSVGRNYRSIMRRKRARIFAIQL